MAADKTVVPTSRWYQPRSIWRSIVIRPKLYAATAGGVAALLLLPSSIPVSMKNAIAWCIGGGIYLTLAILVMWRGRSDRIKMRAAYQDDSAVVILVLILLAVLSSFAAITGLLSDAKAASQSGKLLQVLLAGVTIFVSWSVMQVVFALHYAHEHYAPHNLAEDKGGGLVFPGDAQPDYWDFLYFATSIGATSQTSDVTIHTKALRRLATLHAVVSFFFNTTVLALTVNLAASSV
jgi:uncharacterized membrane protein